VPVKVGRRIVAVYRKLTLVAHMSVVVLSGAMQFIHWQLLDAGCILYRDVWYHSAVHVSLSMCNPVKPNAP
jgi:hypothetical protein